VPEQNTITHRRLLLVDDDGYCLFFLNDILHLEALEIQVVENDSNLFEAASSNDFDAIMLNLQHTQQKDLSITKMLSEDKRHIPLITVSESSDVDFAIDFLRAGAFDFLARPFNNASRVETALMNAFKQRDSMRSNASSLDSELLNHGIVSKSKLIFDILKKIRQIGYLNVNVLITGESGTGKELIARAVHAESNRNTAPFFAVNCGAMPEGLIESIFFGHEKGSFTGATQPHVGFMEKGDGGTVFLDEVGELSPKAQVSLLRFLENREFVKVGGIKTQTADVRIIAATNRNLEQAIDQERFRTDLYYRLSVVHFHCPPLRQRPEDIVHLADYFLKRFCRDNNVRSIKISNQTANLLLKYPWPGNVRELGNLIEGVAAILPKNRDIISSEDVLQYSPKIRDHLPKSNRAEIVDVEEQSYKNALIAFEKDYLTKLLSKYNGNVAKAARHADIHEVTLHRKIKKFGLK
jgi:two-component system, NtrC family, response regulator AtoC